MYYCNDIFRSLYKLISCNKTKYANGGTSSSNKYHKTATDHGMKCAIKMTETAAKKKGYVACKVCY
ncbi:Uncharacterised protein [uncultured Clostridium sp.]|nr:Uncharacterised protein [uncultured Clostridium sp.]